MKRFYRPEDISIDAAYKAELYEVYSSDEKRCVDVDSLVGRCFVGLEAGAPGQSVPSCCLKCFSHTSVHQFDMLLLNHGTPCCKGSTWGTKSDSCKHVIQSTTYHVLHCCLQLQDSFSTAS